MNELMASIYEAVVYDPNFSIDFFQANGYFWIALGIPAGAVLSALYYFMGTAGMAKNRFWLIILLLSGLIAYGWAHIQATDILIAAGHFEGTGTYIFQLSAYSAMLSMLLYILVSFAIRKASTHCARIPKIG